MHVLFILIPPLTVVMPQPSLSSDDDPENQRRNFTNKNIEPNSLGRRRGTPSQTRGTGGFFVGSPLSGGIDAS